MPTTRIVIEGDSKGGIQALQNTARAEEQLGKAIEKTTITMEQQGGTLGRMLEVAGGVGIERIFEKLIGWGKGLAESFIEAASAICRQERDGGAR